MLSIVEMIRNGECSSYSDVPFPLVASEKKFWENFNAPFNFLKHADNEKKSLLDLEVVENEHLLVRLGQLLGEFATRETPESEALRIYLIYSRGVSDRFNVWPSEIDQIFGLLEHRQRKWRLLSWIERY